MRVDSGVGDDNRRVGGRDRTLPGFRPNIGLSARFNRNAKYSLPNFQTHWTLLSWSSDDDV